MTKQALPVLAWEETLSRYAGDREYLEDLVGCFLVDLEGSFLDLRSASETGQVELVSQLAAAIAESAGRVGAMALAEAARLVEREPSAPLGAHGLGWEVERFRDRVTATGDSDTPAAHAESAAGVAPGRGSR